MNPLYRWIIRISGPILVLATWEAMVRFGDVDPILLPSPSTIAVSFVALLISGELAFHAVNSIARLAIGYSLAAVTGITLGLLVGWFRVANDFFTPLIELTRPISPIALIPLAILWFGIGLGSKVFVITMATFFPILLNTIAGVKNTDLLMIRAARSLGAGHVRLLLTVSIPSAAPFIHTGLRIALSIGFIVIIASEMVAAQNGTRLADSQLGARLSYRHCFRRYYRDQLPRLPCRLWHAHSWTGSVSLDSRQGETKCLAVSKLRNECWINW